MIRNWKSLSTAAIGLAVTTTFGLGATSAFADEGQAVTLSLNTMPGSTASGTATLTPTGDGGLAVEIKASNMVPGMPHAQHIHGDTTGKMFVCPTTADDTDGNGFLTVEEGLPRYGNVHISLTTEGDTSMDSGLAVDRMPVADADGNVQYMRTLTAEELPAGTIENLSRLHIVQHGVDANGNNEYDMDGLGESTFAKSLGVDGIPSEATDVATCGMVMPSGGVETGGEAPMSANAGLLGAGGALVLTAGAVALGSRRRATVNGR